MVRPPRQCGVVSPSEFYESNMDEGIEKILSYCRVEIASHIEVLQGASVGWLEPFSRLVHACVRAVASGGTLMFFGNGGSAADAQHFAAELTVRYRVNRRAMRAIALTTDTSALTAIGNDFGFENLFARQVDALCRPGDVVIALSTSGNSENVIRGVLAAGTLGAVTAAFTGSDGGRLVRHVEHAIVVPSTITARIQEVHLLFGHILCGFLEENAAPPR
jgi:D-sedoheptulose 7-phosphate isomerase